MSKNIETFEVYVADEKFGYPNSVIDFGILHKHDTSIINQIL